MARNLNLSQRQQDVLYHTIPLTELRVWDALQTNLTTAGTDNLGLVTGTLGTDHPSLQTGDLKTAGATTMYGRLQYCLPCEYMDGGTCTIRLSSGMVTTVADTSATIDLNVYLIDNILGVGSDICATAAQSINSLTFANKDFTITPASLTYGCLLDIRVAIAVNDGASGTAVIGCLGGMQLILDIVG